jgi:short-subunit dehydrogenase
MASALVTGATAGIGYAFARRLAAEGHGLVLVAREASRLEEVAAILHQRYRVDVETLPADLCDREQTERVADRLRDCTRPIDILVSNAGFPGGKSFLAADISEEERMLYVLVRAVLVLTRAAVPGMVSRGRGNLITVSSVAGFFPGGTYSAAKAWATAFSASLAGELAGTGVTATVLCPGYVRTEFHRRAKMDVSDIPAWAWLDPDRVVADCLADVRRGRAFCVPGLRYKAAVFFLRRIPLRLLDTLSGRRAAIAARKPGH